MRFSRANAFLILLFYTGVLLAQNFKGTVSDASGMPLAGVSVYIEGVRAGLVTDNDGRFRSHLQAGQYAVVFRRLGYVMSRQFILIRDNEVTSTDVSLEQSVFYEYKNTEQRIETMGEQVIKKATDKSPGYASYKAEAYIKGDLMLTGVSNLTNKLVEKIENFSMLELQNKIIQQEIYCNIDYAAPDLYNIEIKGYSGNIAEDLNIRGAVGLLDESLHADWFNGCVSPLSRRASLYYKFKYKGYYIENGEAYNRVEVKSKFKDQELLNGDLYITDAGDIIYARLTRRFQAVEFTSTITYQLVDGKYNIPVAYLSNIYFRLFGNAGEVSYLTSVKYDELQEGKPGTGSKNSPRLSGNKKIVFDDLASAQDIGFWEEVRAFPVSRDEKTAVEYFGQKHNPMLKKPWYGKILMGDYLYGSDTSKLSVKYGGVKMIFRDYNYVDGFWLGNRFTIKSDQGGGKVWQISPYIYYTTARHRMIGGSDFAYSYLPEKNGKLTFSVGSHTADFNSLSITRYNNYFSSLFLGKNYNSFYQKDYVSIGNNIDVTRKLKLSAGLGVERRSGLNNYTDFTLVKVKKNRITPNINPDNRFDRTFYSLGLSYAPHADYTIENNESPLVLHLEYQEGFSAWQTNNSRYRKLKGGIVQNIPLNYFDKIDYKIEAGAFVGSREHLHFSDYQFYGAPDLVFNMGSLFDSFLLLDNYELQANHYWAALSLNYSGKYILLKRLPFMQGKPLFEGLHIKTLYTPDIKFYSEIGYSLNITRLFGVGVFSSFNNFDYKTAGVRFSLNLQSLKILRE
ncbi:carboxypeptidase regulatory-like domain-containing protein [Dysgonomonas sp. 521]|uniref:DUF5686 family protein n=1 Tax=Dysgonomonas sp. 521 TaxID=2302932 RepID=UPI0013CF9FD7|nr:DUF5686 family protein [Dysgonomonas sp. 521]NDV95488.1 carboxypeptidase regulatory-like domain-containing protein [Dysgonomonas sp. 521]